VWKVLAEEGIDAEVELVTSTPTRAKRLRPPEARRSGWTGKTCSPRPNARTLAAGVPGLRDNRRLEGHAVSRHAQESTATTIGAVDAGLHR
jgi:hypothetical protein